MHQFVVDMTPQVTFSQSLSSLSSAKKTTLIKRPVNYSDINDQFSPQQYRACSSSSSSLCSRSSTSRRSDSDRHTILSNVTSITTNNSGASMYRSNNNFSSVGSLPKLCSYNSSSKPSSDSLSTLYRKKESSIIASYSSAKLAPPVLGISIEGVEFRSEDRQTWFTIQVYPCPIMIALRGSLAACVSEGGIRPFPRKSYCIYRRYEDLAEFAQQMEQEFGSTIQLHRGPVHKMVNALSLSPRENTTSPSLRWTRSLPSLPRAFNPIAQTPSILSPDLDGSGPRYEMDRYLQGLFELGPIIGQCGLVAEFFGIWKTDLEAGLRQTDKDPLALHSSINQPFETSRNVDASYQEDIVDVEEQQQEMSDSQTLKQPSVTMMKFHNFSEAIVESVNDVFEKEFNEDKPQAASRSSSISSLWSPSSVNGSSRPSPSISLTALSRAPSLIRTRRALSSSAWDIRSSSGLSLPSSELSPPSNFGLSVPSPPRSSYHSDNSESENCASFSESDSKREDEGAGMSIYTACDFIKPGSDRKLRGESHSRDKDQRVRLSRQRISCCEESVSPHLPLTMTPSSLVSTLSKGGAADGRFVEKHLPNLLNIRQLACGSLQDVVPTTTFSATPSSASPSTSYQATSPLSTNTSHAPTATYINRPSTLSPHACSPSTSTKSISRMLLAPFYSSMTSSLSTYSTPSLSSYLPSLAFSSSSASKKHRGLDTIRLDNATENRRTSSDLSSLASKPRSKPPNQDPNLIHMPALEFAAHLRASLRLLTEPSSSKSAWFSSSSAAVHKEKLLPHVQYRSAPIAIPTTMLNTHRKMREKESSARCFTNDPYGSADEATMKSALARGAMCLRKTPSLLMMSKQSGDILKSGYKLNPDGGKQFKQIRTSSPDHNEASPVWSRGYTASPMPTLVPMSKSESVFRPGVGHHSRHASFTFSATFKIIVDSERIIALQVLDDSADFRLSVPDLRWRVMKKFERMEMPLPGSFELVWRSWDGRMVVLKNDEELQKAIDQSTRNKVTLRCIW